MSRISKENQKLIKDGMNRAKQRAQTFKTFVSSSDRVDPLSTNPAEADKITSLVNEMIDRGYTIYDVLNDFGKGAITSKNDTHSASRKWEKWHGGRGDGKPEPDLPSCEIKYVAVDKKHVLPSNNPVLNIGKIQPKRVKYKNFESSSCYKKMKNMSTTTYNRKTHKLVGSFVFKADNPRWFNRLKEDFEFYLNELNHRMSKGIRSSNSSIVSSGLKSPNGCLQIRSDSIMLTKKFYKEVSEYYDK